MYNTYTESQKFTLPNLRPTRAHLQGPPDNQEPPHNPSLNVFPATACRQTSFVPRTQVFLRSLSNTAAGTLRAHDCVLHHSAQLLAEAMLEADFEAAAGRIFDRLLDVFVEEVVSQPAIMRIQVCQGALTGKRTLLAWV